MQNRGKVEKLVGVRRLLKKLEFLFELPVRLNRSIELEAYAQAVRYYNMASGVLKKYDSGKCTSRITYPLHTAIILFVRSACVYRGAQSGVSVGTQFNQARLPRGYEISVGFVSLVFYIEAMGLLKLVFGYLATACPKRTCAAASAERRRCEPDRVISPEGLARGSAIFSRTHSL